MQDDREGSENKFIQRTIITLLLIAFVFGLVYLFPNWLYCLVVTLFVVAGLFEFFRMVEKRNVFVYKYFGTVIGGLIPIVIFMGNSFPELKNLDTFLIVAACMFVLMLQFIRRDNANDHLASTALTLFSLFYIAWFFSFFIKIKFLNNGSNLVVFLILVTKISDIGAYVIGRRFGRNELIPRISPNKTREGALGGIMSSVVMAVILGLFLTDFSFLHLFLEL